MTSAKEKARAIERAEGRHKRAQAGAQAGATARSSAGAEDWVCDTCGKGFRTKTALKGHCSHGHPFPDRYRATVEDTPWEDPEEEYDEDLAYEDYKEPEQDADGDIPGSESAFGLVRVGPRNYLRGRVHRLSTT